MNVSQYTSFYKTQRNLSTLPVRAHFDETRYKNKKPIPTNNTYVAVEGFLNNVEVDSKSGTPTIFHFSVDKSASSEKQYCLTWARVQIKVSIS